MARVERSLFPLACRDLQFPIEISNVQSEEFQRAANQLFPERHEESGIELLAPPKP
jgi:hypothetical protein